MEARAHPVCGAAPARGRARPGGSDRRLPAWPLAAQQQPRSHPCPPQSLPRDARSALRERPTQRLIHRTAVYGPVRTVVWEGRSREAPPYPDCAPSMFDSLEVEVLCPSGWRRRASEAQGRRRAEGSEGEAWSKTAVRWTRTGFHINECLSLIDVYPICPRSAFEKMTQRTARKRTQRSLFVVFCSFCPISVSIACILI